MSINLYKKRTKNGQPVLEELLSKDSATVADKPLVYDSTNNNVKSTNDLNVNSVTASCFHGPLDGTAKNATCFDNKTYAEACADILSGCAADSNKLNGKTYSEVCSDILSGTAANSTCFAGKTCTEWKEIIKTTCVDNAALATNSTCFNGCTYAQACADIRNGLATQTCADAIQACADFIQCCVTAIEEKIPSQASASNQLADKDFVNSSITTNTANFRGTYACVAELPSTGNTNNDYAFVCSLNTCTGNYIYDRYKWVASDSCWVCEYELNTTGFTAEQLASINSGITDSLVAKITDVYDNTVTVCMNGECKGSFNLNQNTDVCIDLGDTIRNACCANYATSAAQASSATNATCFDGCTYACAKADILSGNASSATNATCFGGCTYSQAKSDILSGTAKNATCFGGCTYACAKEDILSGKAADATHADSADNSTCFGGCTYACAKEDFRNGMAAAISIGDSCPYQADGNRVVHIPAYPPDLSSCDGLDCTGTVTQVKVGTTAYDPVSGIVSLPEYPTIPTTVCTAECANTVKRNVAACSGSCHLALFDGNTAVNDASLYVSNSKAITYSPVTGCLSTCCVRGISGLIAGNPIGCSSTVLGQAGTYVSSGSLELYTTCPSIDFHVNNASADCTQRIIASQGFLRAIVNNGTGCTAATQTACFDFYSGGAFCSKNFCSFTQCNLCENRVFYNNIGHNCCCVNGFFNNIGFNYSCAYAFENAIAYNCCCAIGLFNNVLNNYCCAIGFCNNINYNSKNSISFASTTYKSSNATDTTAIGLCLKDCADVAYDYICKCGLTDAYSCIILNGCSFKFCCDGYLYGNVCGNLCGSACRIQREVTGNNGTHHLAFFAGCTAGCSAIYVSNTCPLTYNPSTGVLKTCTVCNSLGQTLGAKNSICASSLGFTNCADYSLSCVIATLGSCYGAKPGAYTFRYENATSFNIVYDGNKDISYHATIEKLDDIDTSTGTYKKSRWRISYAHGTEYIITDTVAGTAGTHTYSINKTSAVAKTVCNTPTTASTTCNVTITAGCCNATAPTNYTWCFCGDSGSFRSPNTVCVGSGNIGAATAYGTFGRGGIELSSSSPFLDFHFNCYCGDFSTRLINNTQGQTQLIVNNGTGTTTATQTGTFTFCSTGEFNVPSVRTSNLRSAYPSTSTTCDITFMSRCCNASAITQYCMCLCGSDGKLYNPQGFVSSYLWINDEAVINCIIVDSAAHLGAQCDICIYDGCGNDFICGWCNNLTIGYDSSDFYNNDNECCRVTVGLNNHMSATNDCGDSVVVGYCNCVCWDCNSAQSYIYGYCNSTTDGGLAVGGWNYACGECSVVLGWNNEARRCSISIGIDSYVDAVESIAIGCDVSTYSMGAIAIGRNVRACNPESIAIGTCAISELDNGLAIGYNTQSNYICKYNTLLGYIHSDIRRGCYRDLSISINSSSNIEQCELYRIIAERIDLSKDLATQCICTIPDINCSLLVRGRFNNLGITSIEHQKYSGLCNLILNLSDNSFASISSVGSNAITEPIYLEITGLSL